LSKARQEVLEMTNVKRSEIKEYKKPFVKGKFKTYIPTPGDTYKADINIMKKILP
jgi:hypothetical protein